MSAKVKTKAQMMAGSSPKNIEKGGVGHLERTESPEHQDGLGQDNLPLYNDKETVRVLRKIDWRLIPILTLLYLLSYLDRGNIGNAKVAGMNEDLGLTSKQFNLILTLFFIPYALFEIPSNIVLKLMRPSYWISFLVVSWGAVVVGSGFVTGYRSLMAARIILGVFEAGFFPAASYLVGEWYCRFELQWRLSIFFTAASLSGAFSGLLAFALQKMDGIGGLQGWRWIFIIEGIFTCFVGMTLPWTLPDSPSTASFLTSAEKAFIKNRLGQDSGTSFGMVQTEERFKWRYLKSAFTDWKIWFTVFIYWGNTVPIYGFIFTAPTIINQLGYTAAHAQLLTIPIYAVGTAFTLFCSWIADRRQQRWPFVAIPYGVALVGAIGLLAIPHPRYPGLTYAFLFTFPAGMYPAVISLVSWMSNNLSPTWKRATGIGINIMMGNLGGMIGSNIYMAEEAPGYRTGYGVSLACLTLAIFCTLVLRFAYNRENKKRDKMSMEEIRAKYTEGRRNRNYLTWATVLHYTDMCSESLETAILRRQRQQPFLKAPGTAGLPLMSQSQALIAPLPSQTGGGGQQPPPLQMLLLVSTVPPGLLNPMLVLRVPFRLHPVIISPRRSWNRQNRRLTHRARFRRPPPMRMNQQQPSAHLLGARSRPRTRSSFHRQRQRNGVASEPSSPTPSLADVGDLPSTRDVSRFPVFIRPLPPHITSHDLDYLAGKDALTIPDDVMRNELLRAYAEIVHPFMPALDLHGFLNSVLEPRPNSVSLLLFQAVMFASVAFIDVELVQSRGFSSRKAARKVFFNRVRLLYGLDCESEQLALVQTLLLMTYWYDNPNDKKDTWYWMGIALTLAQVSGFHRDPQHLTISLREKRLRRRIWWSCVLRDRLLALGVRRPSRIRDGDFDVPALTVEDFDLSPASDNLLKILGRSKMTDEDPEARSVMAALCVELTKLGVCLGHILHSQYTVTGSHLIGSQHFSSVAVVPKRSKRQAQELARCDQELVDWLQSRDPRSRYAPVSDRNPETTDRIIRLHKSLLHMVYLAALGVLHRPSVFCSGPDPDSNSTRKVSRKKVTDAAIAMTKLAFDLEANDQLRYLSTSGVPAFLSATLIHLLEIRSSGEEVRNISIGRFYQEGIESN
ncbi:hypothetical protein G7Z17_g748 [Cylindrodendrum hubeiense]|uniref:Major facilitator superfamily (MFS) profile domain-containing protein n=1 Tax=Cylindrodendrum hubeiense TaxID=595255 RepID=A0A9P5HGB9_9HYPO|nr:hypothetical protein G7Z17_g748 [Cylindrodendrum hubeiense]